KHLFVHQNKQDNSKNSVFEISTTGAVINKFASPCEYGVGVLVSGDTLFLADRNHDVIHAVSKTDPSVAFGDLVLDRKALFGPRCLALDQKTGAVLHTWTDFQGSDPAGSNASLYDSYILRLRREDGAELRSWFVQDGTNTGTNVRGIEYDPRGSGNSVWVTVLNSGNSSKILKLTLVDGPVNGVSAVTSKEARFKANYPNPFSEATTLPYSLGSEAVVKIVIHDVLGREVFSSAPATQSVGEHEITLNLQSLPSGRYICDLFLNNIRTDHRALVKE
ncbi:MAG: T9SS type A sorting domain-containing protein, partial [Ignavibacteriota bacterium]